MYTPVSASRRDVTKIGGCRKNVRLLRTKGRKEALTRRAKEDNAHRGGALSVRHK